MKKLKLHTQDFLCTLLFVADPDFPEDEGRTFHGASFHEFSAPFAAAVESFIDGFVSYLEGIGYRMEWIELLERSFGGNVFFSLSGHGCGFWDEWPADYRDLGRDLQRCIESYSGDRYRFEELPGMLERNDAGEIDLAFLPDYLDEARAKLFTPQLSAAFLP